MEAVLPIEVQIPSLRVLMDVKLQEAEWVRTRYEELSLIEEKRLAAICHGQLYQTAHRRDLFGLLMAFCRIDIRTSLRLKRVQL